MISLILRNKGKKKIFYRKRVLIAINKLIFVVEMIDDLVRSRETKRAKFTE